MQKKAVVWVSTVLYIMISLAILSMVLVAIQPTIEKNRDKSSVLQSEKMLKDIDFKIQEVSSNEGNVRILNLKISSGSLIINSSENKIVWQLPDSSYQYSQENRIINITSDGRLQAITKKNNNKWDIKIYLNYLGKYNLTYSGQEISRIITEGEYEFMIKNVGFVGGLNQIDFLVS